MTTTTSSNDVLFSTSCELRDIGRGFTLVSNPHDQWVARTADLAAAVDALGGWDEARFQAVCDAHTPATYAVLVSAGFLIEELVDNGCEEEIPADVYAAWCDEQ